MAILQECRRVPRTEAIASRRFPFGRTANGTCLLISFPPLLFAARFLRLRRRRLIADRVAAIAFRRPAVEVRPMGLDRRVHGDVPVGDGILPLLPALAGADVERLATFGIRARHRHGVADRPGGALGGGASAALRRLGPHHGARLSRCDRARPFDHAAGVLRRPVNALAVFAAGIAAKAADRAREREP